MPVFIYTSALLSATTCSYKCRPLVGATYGHVDGTTVSRQKPKKQIVAYVVGETAAVMAADRQQLLLQLELLNIEEQLIDLLTVVMSQTEMECYCRYFFDTFSERCTSGYTLGYACTRCSTQKYKLKKWHPKHLSPYESARS